MDAESNVEPHGALMQLYQVKDCKSWLLHPHDLQGFGIRATQVALMDDESLQFEPRFFQPYPEKILPICYFNSIEDEDDRRRARELNTLPENPFPNNRLPTNPRPEFDAIWKEAQERKPDGDYLHDVNITHRCDLDTCSLWERAMDSRARELLNYLEYFLDINLVDQPDQLVDYSLRGLGKLERWYPRPTNGDPDFEQRREFGNNNTQWEIIDMSRYRGRRPPLPHMTASTISDVRAIDPNQGLILHEVRAIVNMMIFRTNHRPFRTFNIHPVLLFSYMGPHHARIIQAVYDGEGLSIQYSQLFSFEDEETAPTELFLRYNISRPVGLEDVDVCMR